MNQEQASLVIQCAQRQKLARKDVELKRRAQTGCVASVNLAILKEQERAGTVLCNKCHNPKELPGFSFYTDRPIFTKCAACGRKTPHRRGELHSVPQKPPRKLVDAEEVTSSRKPDRAQPDCAFEWEEGVRKATHPETNWNEMLDRLFGCSGSSATARGPTQSKPPVATWSFSCEARTALQNSSVTTADACRRAEADVYPPGLGSRDSHMCPLCNNDYSTRSNMVRHCHDIHGTPRGTAGLLSYLEQMYMKQAQPVGPDAILDRLFGCSGSSATARGPTQSKPPVATWSFRCEARTAPQNSSVTTADACRRAEADVYPPGLGSRDSHMCPLCNNDYSTRSNMVRHCHDIHGTPRGTAGLLSYLEQMYTKQAQPVGSNMEPKWFRGMAVAH